MSRAILAGMPDPPLSKRRPVPAELLQAVAAAPYAELHCRTNYSFLEGASHPDELVQQAAALGYRALAVTDRESLAGVVRAHVAAKEVGLKLIIGAELHPSDGPPVVVWAMHRAGYGRLSRLITVGRRRAEKGRCQLTLEDIAQHSDGLLAGVVLTKLSASDASCHAYREAFGDRLYGLAELHRGPEDGALLNRWRDWSRETGIPLLAAGDVHYHDPSRRYLQDVLTAIRLGCTVETLGLRSFPNAERALRPADDLLSQYGDPALLARTVEIADRCQFSLDELRYEYPEELAPPGVTPLEHLTRLTYEGLSQRYPAGPPEKVVRLVEYELKLIGELKYEAYFLTVWDLVRFARSRDILCQGRGSAANSAVCYCLEVTSVDPERIDVLFERFISRERNEAPDIDIDFEHERREEVLQYLYEKYGRERAGLTATVISYRPRSAVRDVGKALGLSLDRVDLLSKVLDNVHDDDKLALRFREAGLDPTSTLGRQLTGLMRQILGFPRHLSQHVGGMVMTRGPLCELVPIENAAMPGRTVVEWDKDDLDSLGILKVDCLCLGMLSAIRRAFALIRSSTGRNLALATVPAEDPAVYEMISRADTMGVFQIESRAQMSMLPRLKPRKFYDLVIEVAIVRPGPIQGDMVHPYLRRRAKLEAVDYPDERVRSVLEKTLGVPIFQEQAMRLAVVAAGFTPGEADQLRRAMGAWRRRGIMEQFQQKLIRGMLENGYSTDFAERLFRQIQGFGEYGFPESHAASFALLVYVSAWIKRYHPAAFAAALINSQPMGFYAPGQLLCDARKHGVNILPVDVNHSDWDCTLETVAGVASESALRLGLRMISGFSSDDAERIVGARAQGGPFAAFDEFARRTGLPQSLLQRLSEADALRSLDQTRRQANWNALPAREPDGLWRSVEDVEADVSLPAMTPLAEVVADYHSTGLSLRAHPVSFLRNELESLRVTRHGDLQRLPDGRRVRVCGVVLLRQRPGTARGITFVTLEDETGFANLIISQETWERFHKAARTATVMLVTGLLQRQHDVTHILASRIEDLSDRLSELRSKSRDFH
jgi:error-prone DNA polymerase